MVRKNVLFTGLYPMWHYHFSSELDIIQKHIELNQNVTLLVCDGVLHACEANPDHVLAHCLRCIGIRNHGLSLLSSRIHILPLIDDHNTKLRTHFLNINDLKEYHVDQFDVGMAVYSSLVDYSNEVLPDPKVHAEHIKKLITDAVDTYTSALNYLKKNKYDLVYIFNGRYAAARAWVRACEKHGVRFRIHERAGKHDRYTQLENSYLHDTSIYASLINKHWDECADITSRYREASEFFEERPKGRLGTWHSFVTDQDKEISDIQTNPELKQYIIFSSTESEFSATEDFYKPLLFERQLEAIGRIAKYISLNLKHVRLTLRVHPNSKSDKDRWWESPSLTEIEKLIIIPPESKISSYQLLNIANLVITLGSSIGVEATYWGKTSILFGQAYHRGIKAVYEPNDYGQLWQMLENPPPPLPVEGALKYGYYFRTAGEPFSNIEPVNYYTLKFKGEILEAPQTVHQWLGECERRKPVVGLRKWLQNIGDRRRFKKLFRSCGYNNIRSC